MEYNELEPLYLTLGCVSLKSPRHSELDSESDMRRAGYHNTSCLFLIFKWQILN